MLRILFGVILSNNSKHFVALSGIASWGLSGSSGASADEGSGLDSSFPLSSKGMNTFQRILRSILEIAANIGCLEARGSQYDLIPETVEDSSIVKRR